MRIKQTQTIVNITHKYFDESAKVHLFGLRVDERKN